MFNSNYIINAEKNIRAVADSDKFMFPNGTKQMYTFELLLV